MTTFGRVYTLVPYCVRSPDVSVFPSSVLDRVTFTFLYKLNVTSETLLIDHAPIDMIEDYEIYRQRRQLNMNTNDSDENLYYKCMPPLFGTKCQFTFPADISMATMISLLYEWRTNSEVWDVLEQTNGTCIEGIHCDGRNLCLDWREICNGYVDCLNGKDEEFCFELEMNECDPLTEYRCSNGLCISNNFFYDLIADCLDKSDEIVFYDRQCYDDVSWYCEDTTCNPYKLLQVTISSSRPFSCGDGGCIEVARVDPSSHVMRRPPFGCTNGRDILYKRQLFQPTNECLNYLRCAFIFPMAKSECQLLCSSKYTCNAQVKLKCVNQSLIMFPLKPIYDNHVYFLYALNRTYSWHANFVPTFICFDSIRCSQYRVTDIIYNRTCSHINQFGAFHQNEYYGDWKIIFKILHTTFGGCSLPRLAVTKDSTCPHSSLFHCSNSSKCISQHRLQDHVVDCYNGTDENYNGTCDLALPHRFQCKLEKRCIPRRFLIDIERHCVDGSDESLTILCTNTSIESCDILAGRKEVNQIIPFGEICDGIERLQPTIQDQDTDETDCDEYSCVSRYTACNGQWNCRDGSDEHTCGNTLSAEICDFNGDEFFCIQLGGNSVCASVEVIGDGKIDCLGASDEREYCRNKYPYEFERRYRCLNDSKCISPYQICDCHSDCPLEDDESLLLCPWKSSCDRTNFPCIESNELQNQRCDGQSRCKHNEDEWLCDLIDQPLISPFTLPVLSLFKPVSQRSTRKSYTFLGWYCNRGVPIQSTVDPGSFQCFCPPAYYGNRCEYQRKRLSLILEINIPTLLERTNVYKFFISLIQTSNSSIVFHAEEIIYVPYVQCLPKYIIDLLYPIERRENIKHHIRIQIYRLANSSIEYRGAWFFSIKFEFLYVNRIASQIILSEGIFKNTRTNCQTLPCLHGSCELYLNNPEYSFCHCKPGWSGSLCNVKHPQECDCSPDSLCVIPGICFCPLNKIGSRCYLDYNPCQDNPCRNHGICVATDIRTIDAYCVCDEGYFGRNCEHISSRLNVRFSSSIAIPPSILVHFISLLDHSEHQVRSYFKQIRFHESETELFHPTNQLPPIVFIQFIADNKKSLPLHLVLLSSLPFNQTTVEITNSNRCPHINEFFNQDFPSLPYLRRVKFYQRPCINYISCFYDDTQVCLCNKFNQTDCIAFITTNNTARCPNQDNPCQNNGECVQDRERCPTTSICLCPQCTFGSLCQFSIKGYIFSLNTILGPYIKPNASLIEQLQIIHISFVVCCVIFMCGIVDGLGSTVTFCQLIIRQTGRGIYLLSSSLLSILTIIICFIQILLLIFEQINLSSCIIIEYLLKCLPITCDWLHACLSIENVSIVQRGVKFQQKTSYKLAKFVIGLVFLCTICMTVHDPLHRRLLYDEFERRTWCVVSYSSTFLQTYDSTINLINFIAPFIINGISAMTIIVLTARIKARTNQSEKIRFRDNIRKHQHLIISPIVLVLLKVPRVIIAFHTTCIRPTRNAYPYLPMIGYFISYLPYVLNSLIFILPSTVYKQQLLALLTRCIR